jgi:hypothetical protein
MATLTEGDRRCQFATSSRSAASVQTWCNHWHPCSTQVSCGETICGFLDAGAIPAASILCEHTSTHDTLRHITPKPEFDKTVATQPERPEPRQQAPPCVTSRSARATESATSPSACDPDLVVIVEAWPTLTEATRSGIVATVKSARN